MSQLATVLITTRNRKADLRRAISSALEQSGVQVQVIVIDDGSTDGSSDMVAAEFPGIEFYRSEVNRGRLYQRNFGFERARGSVVFTLDDDAAFSTPGIVGQILAQFDNRRVGAVVIPLVDLFRKAQLVSKGEM